MLLNVNKVTVNNLTDCPGTQSESAGKVSACQGCPNQAICASGAARGPDLGKFCGSYSACQATNFNQQCFILTITTYKSDVIVVTKLIKT